MSSSPPSRDEFATEIDRLRLEIQRLRIEVADARARDGSLRDTAARSARLAVRDARLALRRVRQLVRPDPPWVPQAARVEPYQLRQHHATRPDRPRVLHVIANFHLGGSARLVVDIIERLGHAWEQSVVSCDLPPTPAYTGLDLAHHPGRSLDAALHVLRSRRPALLHVHYLGHHGDKYGVRDWEWYRHWFAAAEWTGVPVIENINIPTEPFVSDAVTCYAHVSDYVRERFGRRDGRHVTIYPGSDLELFSRPAGDEPPDGVLGMVYRLGRDKLNERAIDPFIEAIRCRPGTRALIVGGGVLLETHQRRVADAGLADDVEFTGYVEYDALPAHYRRMSVFLAPVHTESFGQVTPFAMGMRLPVVGYDVGAIPEIIGDRSLVAPAADAARLGAIAAALLDDRPRRLAIGAANRERAERSFSVEAMISAYEALYQEVAPVPVDAPSRGSHDA
jgi:glycosyltransferase involved in cell wall biosynthesis